VREKVGMGILYQDAVRREFGNGEFISVKVHGLKLEAESFIIWHRDKPLSSAALAFLRLLRWWRTKHQGNGIGTGIAPKKSILLERELSLRHGDQMRPINIP